MVDIITAKTAGFCFGVKKAVDKAFELADPEKKVYMLMDFAGEHRSIADPWYTGNFDATFNDVMRGCQGLLKHITK